MIECPSCKGKKESLCFHNTGPDSSKHYSSVDVCHTCSGLGNITPEHKERMDYGKKLKLARLSTGESLKDAAARLGVGSAELSSIESGRQSQD
jgi:hypothetical protein